MQTAGRKVTGGRLPEAGEGQVIRCVRMVGGWA